jgi:hypothetical protein
MGVPGQDVGGARPVEPAVSQDCAASLDDHVLDVADRLHPRVRRRPRVQVQRVLLDLHPRDPHHDAGQRAGRLHCCRRTGQVADTNSIIPVTKPKSQSKMRR